MLPRLAVFMTGAALVLPACGDDCGDGKYRDAEICFKEHVLEFEAEAAAPYSLLAADFDGVDLITTAVTDVDGDGRRDLLVLGTMSENPALGVVRQRPDGGFAPPQVQTARAPGLDNFRPAAFVAGRLRCDGPLQLVLAEPDRPSGLARAEVREGALQPPVALPTGLRPGALALGDLDDDDALDVLVLDTAPDALVALRGPDLSEGSPTPLGARPNFLALAHLDGDGSLDLILHHGARLGLWRGVGDGRGDIVAGLFPDGGLAIRLSGP